MIYPGQRMNKINAGKSAADMAPQEAAMVNEINEQESAAKGTVCSEAKATLFAFLYVLQPKNF
jgi:hypothetical protein